MGRDRPSLQIHGQHRTREDEKDEQANLTGWPNFKEMIQLPTTGGRNSKTNQEFWSSGQSTHRIEMDTEFNHPRRACWILRINCISDLLRQAMNYRW
jgi:hypothetical protein